MVTPFPERQPCVHRRAMAALWMSQSAEVEWPGTSQKCMLKKIYAEESLEL